MNIETANRLLQYRKKMNLSQEELASRIGVSRQAVSKWERAEASPDTDNLILLADIYGVSLDELLKGEKETESETQSEEPENNAENNPDSDTTYKKSDKVSFKHGIHVDSKDGDSVQLNFRDGIHVKDKDGTKVDVGWNGIHVEENGKTKVHFYPITGRTHQLRVHASHNLGLHTPIVGDDLYGTKADRLHLHAEYIQFEHPITKEVMEILVEAEF